jgi:hypothetical protein
LDVTYHARIGFRRCGASPPQLSSGPLGSTHKEVNKLLTALFMPAIWFLKSFTYWVVFRIRKIRITGLSCLIIGGISFLLMLVPIPFPGFLSFPIIIGVAVYLTMHYTRVELIPNGLFIPLGVEVFFRIGIWLIQELSSLHIG